MPGKSDNIWAEVGQREKLHSTGVMRWRKHYQIESLVFNTYPTTHLVMNFHASVSQWPTTHWRESQPSSLGPLTPPRHFLCLVQKSDLNRWCFRMRFLLESNCSCRANLSRRRKCVWMTSLLEGEWIGEQHQLNTGPHFPAELVGGFLLQFCSQSGRLNLKF